MDNYAEEYLLCSKSGKFCYTYRQAQNELIRMRKEGYQLKGFHLEVYYCTKCQKFHIGSQANRLRKGTLKRKPVELDGETEED